MATWGYVRPEKQKIAVQLTRVMRGRSRLLTAPEVGCSAGLIGRDLSDSQADSAGSIPVTRSNVKVQVGEVFRTLTFGHLEAEAGRGPLACHWEPRQRTVSCSGLPS